MFKRYISIIALILCAVMLFSACKDTDGTGNETNTGIENSEETPSVDGPVYDGTDIASSPFVGTFKNTYSALFASKAVDVFESEDDIPYLVCEPTGDFTFYVNDLANDGLISVSGKFTVNSDTAYFTMSGESEPYFTMELINENEMRYSGSELYCVSRGDIFEKIQVQ